MYARKKLTALWLIGVGLKTDTCGGFLRNVCRLSRDGGKSRGVGGPSAARLRVRPTRVQRYLQQRQPASPPARLFRRRWQV